MLEEWSWMKFAACHGEDLTLFFGRDGERAAERDSREAKAKVVCAGCPVLQPCREVAFEMKMDNGVWGGLGEEERPARRRSWQRSTTSKRRIEAAEVQPVDDKHCPGCETTKPAADFPKDRRQPDGLNRTCKACANEAGREQRRARQRKTVEAA